MSSITEKNLDWDFLVKSNEPIFWNFVFDKGRLKTFVSWFFKKYGEKKTLILLERLKEVGFGYATNAGVSLGLEDLKIPPQKNQLLAKAEMDIQTSNFLYRQGRLTGIEKMQKFIETWHETSETLKEAVVRNFEKTDILNPVYMMAFSGARGNMSQVRQLVGMRGLMSDPQGKIIDFPIQSNFREGLTLTEYLISTYGARKGIVDTALRTATAGYLTRRLVDVAQHVIVSRFDCGTQRGIFLFDMKEGNQTLYSFQNRLIGRVLAQNISNNKIKQEDSSPLRTKLRPSHTGLSSATRFAPTTSVHTFTGQQSANNSSNGNISSLEKFEKFIALRNQEVTFELALIISKLTKKALVRSPLTCENRKLVCQLCYGWSLATSRLVSIGEAVGVIAGQSIGEPGTQLTMRTFHTGGVFSAGVTQQITAAFSGFVEYSEPIAGTCVRTPHGQFAFLTKTNGTMFLKKAQTSLSMESQTYKLPAFTILFARHGQLVQEHDLIAQISALPVTVQTTQTIEQTIYSRFEGEVYYHELDLLEDIDEKYGERISISEDWSKVWILAGKIYKPALQSTFLVSPGDFFKKTTVLNQIQWASPPIFTSQSFGSSFYLPTQPTTKNFQTLRYISSSDLGCASFSKVHEASLGEIDNADFVDLDDFLRFATNSDENLKQKNKSAPEFRSELRAPSSRTTSAQAQKSLLGKRRSPSSQFRIRSVYLLKDFFRISKNQFKKPIFELNKTFPKTLNLNDTTGNLRQFLYFSQMKRKILKTLITDSFSAYLQIKQVQLLIFQTSVSFPFFVPGTLARFIQSSTKEKKFSFQGIQESQIHLKNLKNVFRLQSYEENTALHPFNLVNYVPFSIKIKTLQNYFNLSKNSTFMNYSSSLKSSLKSSALHFFPSRSQVYLSCLRNIQKRSNMNILSKEIKLTRTNQNSSSEMVKGSQFSYSKAVYKSLKQESVLINEPKRKNLSYLKNSVNTFPSFKPVNPLRFENLILKRSILLLPIQQVSYSNFGYVLSMRSKGERFFAFSSLTKNRFKQVLNSEIWKPISFQTDLQWFPENASLKLSGILMFKNPILYKRLLKQTLINSNLKSGKSLLASLNLQTTLKIFDLSNSQVQKKGFFKERSGFRFSNSVVNVKVFTPFNQLNRSTQISLSQTKSTSYESSSKLKKFNEFDLNLSALGSSSQKRTRISSLTKLSFFLFRKVNFRVKHQNLSKNDKKLDDLRQLLFSLVRKQIKSTDNLFFKLEETEKLNFRFNEIEWIPQENYRLHFCAKQKTLNNYKKHKIFFITKNFLQNQNSSNLKLYLKNLQGKKKKFSFKYEGSLDFNLNSRQIFTKTNLKSTSELRSELRSFQASPELTSEFRCSPNKDLIPIDLKNPEIQTKDLYIDTNFLIDFSDYKASPSEALNERSSERSSGRLSDYLALGRDKQLNLSDSRNISNSSITVKKIPDLSLVSNAKDSLIRTHSLKLSFLNYLKQKVVNRYRQQKSLNIKLNVVYACFQKYFLKQFFTFIPLIQDNYQSSLNGSTDSKYQTSTFCLNSLKNKLLQESYIDLTIKPGWIYCPRNLAQIFMFHKTFAKSGKNCIDDILFEQHKVFLEVLPKTVHKLSHLNYSLNSQSILDKSSFANNFNTKLYIRSSKNRFLENSPLKTIQTCCLFIRPVYYQSLPSQSKMKTLLYRNVQKQQELNFFISFNFYKNYSSKVLNLQTNFLRTITNFAKLDINIKELSLFQIQSTYQKDLIKKSVPGPPRNVIDNVDKKNYKRLSLTDTIQRSIDSRHFLRKFYPKKNSQNLILRSSNQNSADRIQKQLLPLQSHYFSNGSFNYIPLNVSLLPNKTNSEICFSEISFHRSNFKPKKVCFSNINFCSQVRLNDKRIRIKNDQELKTLKFQRVLNNYNQKQNCFDKLPFFEYFVSSAYSFFANQRLLASVFSKENIALFNNCLRFKENSFNSNSYTNSFLKLPLSKNVLLLNSQTNRFGQIIGLTNFGSPFEGEILTNLDDRLTRKSLKKTINVYLEKTLKTNRQSEKLILTSSDIFSLRFLSNNCGVPSRTTSTQDFLRHRLRQSFARTPDFENQISQDQDRLSVIFFDKKTTKNTFRYLLDKYSAFKKVEEMSFQGLNPKSYSLEDFQTTYQHRTYQLNDLRMGFLSETKKLRLGHFLQSGEKLYSKTSLLHSGQIIHLSFRFITLRKAEFFSVSPKAILHTYNGNYLEKNLPVMTLPFETLKTGDIVQGIPKVEQYLEARTTIKGRLFLNSLPVLLQAIYKRYLGYFNMESAVRQSFLKIQQILVDGVQRVYRSQGVSIADKHLEIIVRQMTSKVRIVHGGQTGFFSGELVDLEFVERLNRFLKVKIRYEPVVLGITRASLEVDSFLSAASFQQTTKVLTRAAIENRRDFLKGLKESLLVGNLLPAGTGYVLPIRKRNEV